MHKLEGTLYAQLLIMGSNREIVTALSLVKCSHIG